MPLKLKFHPSTKVASKEEEPAIVVAKSEENLQKSTQSDVSNVIEPKKEPENSSKEIKNKVSEPRKESLN